jgi:2-polyprenyl-6-methoxyphenol hydroxylase-like FAD-dependent oxidoreductase
MPRIMVLGGGVCGLAAAIMLARDGHEVTVLERDSEPVPNSFDEAWEQWRRGGVAQFRQAHYLQPGGREVLDAALPDVREALVAAGALEVDPMRMLPRSLPDRAPRPGDERFVTFNARRPTVELVFARAAENEPRVDVRRGVSVIGLTTRALDGVPHVTGVRLDGGADLHADLVVDAMGRRSALPRWLSEAGARPVHEEAEDCGFLYYTRFFASSDGTTPQPRAPFVTPIGTFSILTLPSERGTWCVTLYASSGDQPLKRLRHADRWTAVARACPRHAHWLEGEPITDVVPMGGVIDRYRRFVVDGRPIATGVAAVGDAWACTNPSLGRGITLGLKHAAGLREVVRDHLDGDPRGFAEAWDEVTERELTPWYRATIAVDRARRAEVEALREGREPPRPPDEVAMLTRTLPSAMGRDADVFRAGMAIVGCLEHPSVVLARSGFAERIARLASADGAGPPSGPTREELLALLA